MLAGDSARGPRARAARDDADQADESGPIARPSGRRDTGWVSASEIGTYEYCARAYWLERVERTERRTGTGSRLADGTGHHWAHGRRVAWQRRLAGAAAALIFAGVLLLLVHAATRHGRPGAHSVPVFSL